MGWLYVLSGATRQQNMGLKGGSNEIGPVGAILRSVLAVCWMLQRWSGPTGARRMGVSAKSYGGAINGWRCCQLSDGILSLPMHRYLFCQRRCSHFRSGNILYNACCTRARLENVLFPTTVARQCPVPLLCLLRYGPPLALSRLDGCPGGTFPPRRMHVCSFRLANGFQRRVNARTHGVAATSTSGPITQHDVDLNSEPVFKGQSIFKPPSTSNLGSK
jgi:hypothetical protein